MSSPRRNILLIVSMLAILLSETSARAANLTQTQVDSIDFQTTGFTDRFVFDKFDPALGKLNSVELIVAGSVRGSLSLENRSASAKIIIATLRATLTLHRADGSTLLIVAPEDSTTADLAAFDGTIDFSGTSGTTIGGLTGDASESYQSTTPPSASDLSLFEGTGDFTLTISSGSRAVDNANGELSGRIEAEARATATLRYNYTTVVSPPPLSVVPEPSSFALLGIGGGFSLLFGHWRRRSRRNAV